MNKGEFISELMNRTDLQSKAQATRVLDAVFDIIKDELATGGNVQFVGFGTFETSERAARIGRNPQTGEELKIPATVVPKFKAGSKLKDAVNA